MEGFMKFCSFLVFFACFLSFCSAEVVDQTTGESFPEEVAFDAEGKNYTLDATGVSTRKKFMFKVYSIASYLEKGGSGNGDKFERVMNPDLAKQLTMKWVRDVNAARVQDGFKQSLVKSQAPSEETEMFINFFGDVKTGDETVIRYIPGGTVEVLMNGTKKGVIQNQEFANALWLVWFGNNSAVKRDQLVSLM